MEKRKSILRNLGILATQRLTIFHLTMVCGMLQFFCYEISVEPKWVYCTAWLCLGVQDRLKYQTLCQIHFCIYMQRCIFICICRLLTASHLSWHAFQSKCITIHQTVYLYFLYILFPYMVLWYIWESSWCVLSLNNICLHEKSQVSPSASSLRPQS